MSKWKQILWGTLLFVILCAFIGVVTLWEIFASNNIKPMLLGITLAAIPMAILIWIMCVLIIHQLFDDNDGER